MEELNNIGNAGRRGRFPGDLITHESAYELERRGLVARNKAGDWVTTPAGERLLAGQMPTFFDPSGRAGVTP